MHLLEIRHDKAQVVVVGNEVSTESGSDRVSLRDLDCRVG